MLFSILKSETKELHDSLEIGSVMHTLVSGEGDRDLYINILKALSPLYRTLSSSHHISSWCKENHPNSIAIRGYDLINNELQRLSNDNFEKQKIKEWCDWNYNSQIIGTLYVIEGSTLGGMQISKSLDKHYGLKQAPGNSFFNPYGKECSNSWKNFQVSANSRNSNANSSLAVESAKRTFLQYMDSLKNVKGN